MSSQPDVILKSLMNLSEIDHISSDNLKTYSTQYPYSSILQLLYTKELKEKNDVDFSVQSRKTSLFFPFSPWYAYLLHSDMFTEDFLNVKEQKIDQKVEIIPELQPDELNIPLDPYHTIDYFASQGINISHIDDKDEFGKKVKSFTAWLKTMKRLQPDQVVVSGNEQESDPHLSASDSRDMETIVTEAMAEVYIKQGSIEKAIDIYHKLSLQNPDNSHIFADKISVLKDKRP